MGNVLLALSAVAIVLLLALCTSFLAGGYRQLLAISEVLADIRRATGQQTSEIRRGLEILNRLELAIRHPRKP
jgi:hypothetical protein